MGVFLLKLCIAMESLLKNLKKHVECSICLDTFTDPKTIACLHTFCCECVKKHALVSKKEGYFLCPECQARIALPEGNRFDKLPTSFHHNSLLDLFAVRQSGHGNEVSCGLCKKKSAEISYCFGCEKLMCGDCSSAHEVFRSAAFEGHKVTPVKQFQAEDYEAMLKRLPCCSEKYHEREVMRFYCRNCQACVCQVCLATDHKNHNIELLEKAADSARAKLLSGTEAMRKKEDVCTDAIREFDKMSVNLETNVADAKLQVSRSAEEMITAIRERERETFIAIENIRVSRMERLDSTKKQVQLLAKQFNQAAEFASDMAQRSSGSDILQSNRGLEERFQELAKIQVPALPVSSFVKFTPHCTLENWSLGVVRTSETDPNISAVEVLSQNFQAGVEVLFFICPKTHKGEASNKYHTDQVEMLIEPTDQVAGLMINEQLDGNFEVKFIPKVPGAYNINPKINGKKLAKSPFTVQVMERRLEIVSELHLQNEALEFPAGIAVNSKGQIAVADRGQNCVMVFDEEGKYVWKLGCKGKNAGQLNCPTDVTFVNDDEILVADEGNHRLQQINVHTGICKKGFGEQEGGKDAFRLPRGVCMDSQGRIVVTEYGCGRVKVMTKDGETVFKFGNKGPEELGGPQGCVYHKSNFIVSDYKNKCLKVFNSSGKFLRKIGEQGQADGQFQDPWGLCIDSHGNILVCDRNRGNVQQFSFEGQFTGKTVDELQNPSGITTMQDGSILVSDYGAHEVFVLQ